MVKGVNRQIIEINNTDSEYFEKALLFLRAGKSPYEKEAAEKEAKEYIRSLEEGSAKPAKRPMKLLIAALTVCLALSLTAVAVLLVVCTKM